MTGETKSSPEMTGRSSHSHTSESEIQPLNFYPTPPQPEPVFSPHQMNFQGMQYLAPVGRPQYSEPAFGYPQQIPLYQQRRPYMHMQVYSKCCSGIKCCSIFDIFTSLLLGITTNYSHEILDSWRMAGLLIAAFWFIMASYTICSLQSDTANQPSLRWIKRYFIVRLVFCSVAPTICLTNIFLMMFFYQDRIKAPRTSEGAAVSIALIAMFVFLMTLLSILTLILCLIGICLSCIYNDHMKILIENHDARNSNAANGYLNH